jgi:hypothetical protein
MMLASRHKKSGSDGKRCLVLVREDRDDIAPDILHEGRAK